MTKKSRFPARLVAFISSPLFFRGTVGFLVLQAAWIALSGRYPMAFDEDFHLGIIRLYAHHISPFWSGHPAGGDAFGAVARDPSYLYHWLMSFPYRLISLFTQDQTLQVLWLRALNIGLFAGGLSIYRRLLLMSGASKAIVHGSLLIFVLVPVVPLLAAQINYDNLLIPLSGFLLLLTLRLSRDMRRNKPINITLVVMIISGCLLASVVKYAFIPVFIAISLFLLVRLRQVYKRWRVAARQLRLGLNTVNRRLGVALLVALAVSGTLAVERYGLNLARYHTPVPDCDQVLSIEACSAYGPWIRDYNFNNNLAQPVSPNPITYSQHWLYGMWLRLFFAVDGPTTNFQTKGPLLLPGLSAVAFAGLSVAALAVFGKRLVKRYDRSALGLFGLGIVLYIPILWLTTFQAYLHTGHPVAINGRYLLPVLPFLLLVSAMAFNEMLRRRTALKLLLSGLALVCLLWGGGALTYILRSNDAWYWPGAQPVYAANHAVQKLLGPLTPGYDTPTEFLH